MKKRFVLWLLFIAITGCPLFAQEENVPVFTLKTVLDGKTVFKSGDKIIFKSQCEYPQTYLFCGWHIFAYLNNIPENFCTVLRLKPKIADDPKWSSVALREWTWLPQAQRGEKEAVCSFSTDGWPAGDYRIGTAVLFVKKDSSATLPDVYRQSSLVFTIEK